ncbi:hypothetical protein HDU85_006869, partial [Gaertneriomyces sp. JEL0708]
MPPKRKATATQGGASKKGRKGKGRDTGQATGAAGPSAVSTTAPTAPTAPTRVTRIDPMNIIQQHAVVRAGDGSPMPSTIDKRCIDYGESLTKAIRPVRMDSLDKVQGWFRAQDGDDSTAAWNPAHHCVLQPADQQADPSQNPGGLRYTIIDRMHRCFAVRDWDAITHVNAIVIDNHINDAERMAVSLRENEANKLTLPMNWWDNICLVNHARQTLVATLNEEPSADALAKYVAEIGSKIQLNGPTTSHYRTVYNQGTNRARRKDCAFSQYDRNKHLM